MTTPATPVHPSSLNGEVSTGHGGRRDGAGRPNGLKVGMARKDGTVFQPYKPTSEKSELLRLWRQEMAKHMPAIIKSQLLSAVGQTHLQIRDKSGRWAHVTDPDRAATALNRGDKHYRLTSVSPNTQALAQIMDRLFGSPKQSIEVDVQPTTSLSDAELADSLNVLLDKLQQTHQGET
jgi:hypothetical protein